MFAPDPITRIVAAEPMIKQKSSNIIAELFIIISFDRQVDQLSSKCDRAGLAGAASQDLVRIQDQTAGLFRCCPSISLGSNHDLVVEL